MRKKFLSAVLAMMFVILTIPAAFTADAAYPSGLSRSNYIKAYLLATGNNTPAFDPNNRSTRIGTIYSTDELWLWYIGDDGIMGSYPLDKGGRREFFLPVSYLTNGRILGHEDGTAAAQITTYRRASTSHTYGYVSKNDKITKIDERNGFVQILYPISGGYKIGWIKSADYNAYIKKAAPEVIKWEMKDTIQPPTNSVPKVNGHKLAGIESGEYMIWFYDTFYTVDVAFADTKEGSTLIGQLPNYNNNQKFYIQKYMLNDGRWIYTISPMHARDKLVGVDGSSTKDGALLTLSKDTGIDSQKWWIVEHENGKFVSFINVNSSSYMDLDDGHISNYNGQKIHQWNNLGGTTGKFRLTKISGSSDGGSGGTTYENATVKATRKEIVDKAMSLVNRVAYFWGGKYSQLGENPAWGSKRTVTAKGSRTTGKSIIYGLDCSGMVDWVYWQFGYKGFSGKNSAGQIDSIKKISKSEIKPGDIGYQTGHIGIYAGKVNGADYWIHAAGTQPAYLADGTYAEGGKVTYGPYTGFTSYGRVGTFIGD